MRNFIITVLFAISLSSFGQLEWRLSFDDTAHLDRVAIDKTLPNNIWQIGRPRKSFFDSAYSFPNAIITDTINPYPINNISRFIITHYGPFFHIPNISDNWLGNTALILDFYFKMNTDSLSDYGMIEVSSNNGKNWINVMSEDSAYHFTWLQPKPVLTGIINKWTHFSVNLNMLPQSPYDTILYRFTFISDSIQTNKEGWILDSFLFRDYWEGVENYQSNNLISIYPNPADDFITIHRLNKANKGSLQIQNCLGEIILSDQNFRNEIIPVRLLHNGIYFVRYFDGQRFFCSKFIVEH